MRINWTGLNGDLRINWTELNGDLRINWTESNGDLRMNVILMLFFENHCQYLSFGLLPYFFVFHFFYYKIVILLFD